MYWIRAVIAFLAIGVFLPSASASLHLSSARLASDSPFKLPVPPGVYVEVTQGNNMPSPDWDHNGLSAYAFDFALLTGTYNFVVTAAQGGKVISVDDSSTTRCDGLNHEAGKPEKVKFPGCWTHANYVLIADSDGTTAALYMHLLTNSAKVRVGYDVKQGQQLGLADTTGFALGNPHLHFQVEEIPSQDAQKNQPAGWWFTQSVPVSFSNPEVVKQHKDGVPLTYDKFCLGDKTCSSTPPPNILPGGLWTDPSPKDGQAVSDVIHLAAHAYPTHSGDPAIAEVNFTVGSQGPWRVACTAVPPATGDVFACDANLKDLGVPYGQIQVSFDVYDQAGNVNLAPNGVHTLTYVDFSPFVGRWFGHARGLIFQPDGHATYTGRVFRWCEFEGITNPSPCDTNNGEIVGGLNEDLLFTRVVGSTVYGTIVSGTDDYGPGFTNGGYDPHGQLLLKVGDQISLTLGPNDKLSVSDGWTLCGPQTPSDDPACSGA